MKQYAVISEKAISTNYRYADSMAEALQLAGELAGAKKRTYLVLEVKNMVKASES